MTLANMTPQQRQLAVLVFFFLIFATIMLGRSIRYMQFLAAQAHAYNAIANAIEEGAPVTIPITVNNAKFSASDGYDNH